MCKGFFNLRTVIKRFLYEAYWFFGEQKNLKEPFGFFKSVDSFGSKNYISLLVVVQHISSW